MTQTYGSEMTDLIRERGEEPALVGVQNASHDAMRLYRFSDGFEVIETNAGVCGEADDGFAEARDLILAD